jgi:hypothetical protein
MRALGNSFVRKGRLWSIAYEGTGANLVELKGFHDISRLLGQPNESVHCLELSGAPSTNDSPDSMLDLPARREYRQRIEELQTELEQAESDNDPARGERARCELDAVIEELARATGLGGQSRILDVATGTGFTARRIRTRGA